MFKIKNRFTLRTYSLLQVLAFTIQITLTSSLHFLHPSVFFYKIMEENSYPKRLLGWLRTVESAWLTIGSQLMLYVWFLSLLSLFWEVYLSPGSKFLRKMNVKQKATAFCSKRSAAFYFSLFVYGLEIKEVHLCLLECAHQNQMDQVLVYNARSGTQHYQNTRECSPEMHCFKWGIQRILSPDGDWR